MNKEKIEKIITEELQEFCKCYKGGGDMSDRIRLEHHIPYCLEGLKMDLVNKLDPPEKEEGEENGEGY